MTDRKNDFKTDLTCNFDKSTGRASISEKKGGIALMFGENMKDVVENPINRMFGARPGLDYEGTAIRNGDHKDAGVFSVSTVSRDQISCSADGLFAFGPKK